MPVRFEEDKPASRVRFEADRNVQPKRIPVPAGESVIRGAAQGATLGFADEATAGIGAAYDYAMGKLGKRGDIPLSDAYDTRLKSIRNADDLAQAENPGSFIAGQVGGGIAGFSALGAAANSGRLAAVAPRLAKALQGTNTALNPAAGASLKAKLGAAALGGGIAGAGTSKSNPLDGPRQAANFGEDVAAGATVGGLTQGALSAAGAGIRALTPTNVAKKAANVVLNTPEELTETYIKRPKDVMSAPRRFEIAREYTDEVLPRLKDELQKGSQASRDILTKEGQKIKGSEIAALAKQRADEILARTEGVWDDPQVEAAYKWLRNLETKYGPNVVPGSSETSALVGPTGQPIVNEVPEQVIDRELSTNRVKDTLQGIDRQTDYEIEPGKFGRIDDTVKKGFRSDADELLKGRSEAYKAQMVDVAKDAQLLGDATDLGTNPKGLANVFRRVETDQYGSGQLPKDTLQAVDKRLGTKLLDKAKLSNTREQFDKSITNGSMNVNKFSNMLKDVPLVKYVAPLVGATVDKYGRKMTMGAVDAAVELNRIYQKEGVQSFVKAAQPYLEAARQSNPSALLTLQMLTKANPEAARVVRGE